MCIRDRLITSLVRLVVPFPLIPPKLYNPAGLEPQADSNPSCATNDLANAGFKPFDFNNLS